MPHPERRFRLALVPLVFAPLVLAALAVPPAGSADAVAPSDDSEVVAAPAPSGAELDAVAPDLSIRDASGAEGDGRRRELRFPLELSRPLCGPVRVRWQTEDGTATAADGDYVPATGEAWMRPGRYSYQTVFRPFGSFPRYFTRMVADRHQNLFVTDNYRHTVTRYDASGSSVQVWGGLGTALGKFNAPTGIAIGPDGLIRVSDTGNNRIVLMTGDGQCLKEIPIPFGGGFDSHLDAGGNLYVMGWTAIRKFDPAGRLVRSLPNPGGIWDGFAVDASGNLFVGTDYSVIKCDSTGTILRTFGNRGLPPDGLERVENLMLDPCGNVLVTQEPGLVSMFDNDGNFIERWGELGSALGQLDHPGHMTMDPAGNLYVHDRFNERVQKFQPGVATGEVVVEVRSDVAREPDETFHVRVLDATNAGVSVARATGTIVDDDSVRTGGVNAAGNPSFEASLDGWRAYGGAVLSLTAEDAHHGAAAVRVAALAPRSYSGINDSPDWVRPVREAGAHRYTAWVRSAGFRGRVRLRVREYFDGVTVGSWWSAPADLGDDWAMLALDVPASRAGATLDFNVLHDPFSGPAPGSPAEAFLVDDVRIDAPGRRDEAPIVTAPADLLAYAGIPIEIDVTAHDPDGQPLDSLVAAVPTPSGAGARLTTSTPIRGGRLTWTPEYRDVLLEPHTLTFTAHNALSDWARTRVLVVPVSHNRFRNPTFPNATWWQAYQGATIAPVPLEGRGGDGALRVASVGTTDFGVNDDGYQVRNLPAGALLIVRGWVRSGEPRASVRIRLREYSPGGVMIGPVTYSAPVTLTEEWQLVTLRYVTREALSKLDLQFVAKPTEEFAWFLLDDVEARQVLLPPGVGPDYPSAPAARAGEAPLAAAADSPLDFAARVFPNPARGAATLALTLPVAGRLRAELFDASGRRVRTLIDEREAPAGARRLDVGGGGHGRALAPGLYFFRVESAAGIRSGRFVVLE